MSYRVIPNPLFRLRLRGTINAALDSAIERCPGTVGRKDRKTLYRQLIDMTDESGHVPDFDIRRRENP